MNAATLTPTNPRQIAVLLRGEPEVTYAWTEKWDSRRAAFYILVIFVGTGLYGAAMGYWRDPIQALYTGIKFPLVILLTTLGNGLLNGMLAPLLGINISFRQSLSAVLMSFTIAATILGSFAPVVFFLIWNVPPMAPGIERTTAYPFLLLVQVGVIAFAGIVANVRLLQLLERLGGSAAVARKTLLAWLAANLFFGSQLSWILRPFVGSPGLPVEFLRGNAFQGNFFEAVIFAARKFFAD